MVNFPVETRAPTVYVELMKDASRSDPLMTRTVILLPEGIYALR